MRTFGHLLREPATTDDRVRWGEQLCVIRCGRLAECLYMERPVCLACANELFDRELAADVRRRGVGDVTV